MVISLSGNKDHHRQSVDCQQDSKPISKAKDMLDLNLEIASCESSSICEDKNKRKINHNYSSNNSNIMAMQMEDSGTSNSPIINNEEAADNSSNNYVNFPFVFDIFKKENKGDDNKYYNYHPAASAAAMTTVLDDKAVPITRLLFPVTGAESTTSTTAGQWLKLSCAAAVDDRQGLKAVQQKQQQVRKRRRGPRSRSSRYRGVTFYRRTSRWESHIWDCGKQVYLGAFDTAHTAARVYDLTAIKFRGVAADLNFNVTDYEEDMKQMKHLSKEEFVLTLRRQSRGFARGSSRYRGDSLHKCGRWEARMRQLVGKTYVYLGLLDNEAEAPRAYDKSAIKHSGREAVINFEPSAYQREMLLDSNNGGSSNYLNLDLSLTISQPLNTIHCEAGEMPNKERPVEMAKEKRVQGVSSPRFTNWAWQMHRNGNVAAVPYGFSSSPTTPAANTIQLQQQINNNPAARNRFLATQNTSAAINNSHHFRNYRT